MDHPTLGTGEPGLRTIGGEYPTAEAERAAPLHVDLWLARISNTGHLTLAVRTWLLLQDIQHRMNGTRTMADVIFDGIWEGIPHPQPWSTQTSRFGLHRAGSGEIM